MDRAFVINAGFSRCVPHAPPPSLPPLVQGLAASVAGDTPGASIASLASLDDEPDEGKK